MPAPVAAAVSTAEKAFVGYEFVELVAPGDDYYVTVQKSAGNGRFASVSMCCSIVTVVVVDVVSMVAKAFVGCESDLMLEVVNVALP